MVRLALLLLLLAAAPARGQTWEALPPMATPRADAAWAVLDGRLYVVGGRGAGGALLASGEVYTPGAGWSALAPLGDARAGAAAVAVGGRLWLLGGRDDEGPTDDVDVYDPAVDAWDDDAVEDLERARDGLAAGVVGGAVFALGGAGEAGALLGTAEAYDAADDDWEAYAPWALAPARARMGVASTADGLVVAGGFSAFGPLVTVERFVPGQGAVALPFLPSARGGLALAHAGGVLVAVGGRDAQDARLASVVRLDPTVPLWLAATPLPEPREGAAAAFLGGDLVVAGGTGPFGSVLASAVVLRNYVAEDGGPAAPADALNLAGPNPARGTVRLWMTLGAPADVRVDVLDVRGRAVAVLAAGAFPPGAHALAWDARGAAPGVYSVRMATPAGVAVRRVAVVR